MQTSEDISQLRYIIFLKRYSATGAISFPLLQRPTKQQQQQQTSHIYI